MPPMGLRVSSAVPAAVSALLISSAAVQDHLYCLQGTHGLPRQLPVLLTPVADKCRLHLRAPATWRLDAVPNGSNVIRAINGRPLTPFRRKRFFPART